MDFNFVYVLLCTSYGASKVVDAYLNKDTANETCKSRNEFSQMDGGTRVYTVEEVFITDSPV